MHIDGYQMPPACVVVWTYQAAGVWIERLTARNWKAVRAAIMEAVKLG